MLRLLRYDLRNIFTRKSTYIIPVIGLILFVFLHVFFGGKDQDKFGLVFTNSFFFYAAMFVLGFIYVIVQVVYTFKKPVEDGTALMMLSRPISKLHRAMMQVGSVFCSIVIFALFWFVSGFLIGVVDPRTDKLALIRFAGSLLFGNILILSIVASIIVFSTTGRSSLSVIIFWTLIAVFIPIISFIIDVKVKVPFAGAENANFYVASNKVEKVSKDNIDTTKSIDSIYFDGTKSTPIDYSQQNSWEAFNGSWYRNVVWADPWYQLSGLYSMFNESHNISDKNWTQKNSAFHIKDGDLVLNINNHKYGVMIKRSSVNPDQILDKSNIQKIDSLFTNTALVNEIKLHKVALNALPFERQMIFAQHIMEKALVSTIVSDVDGILTTAANSSIEDFSNNTTPYSLFSLYALRNLNALDISKVTNLDTTSLLTKGFNKGLVVIKDGDTYNHFIPSDIIPRGWVAFIWIIIFLGVTSVSFYFYSKKELA